jgi:hypothetical protein
MKTIANNATMIRQARKRSSLLATTGKYIAETPTASKKLMPMTSIQNKFLSVLLKRNGKAPLTVLSTHPFDDTLKIASKTHRCARRDTLPVTKRLVKPTFSKLD